MGDIEQPELHGADKHGNVRPADDRFLTRTQKRKRDAYVTKVAEAKADAAASRDVSDDPLAEILNAAVERRRPDVTPVTSARGEDSDDE